MISQKSKKVASTPFSDFIRNANSKQRKRVYNEVIKQSVETQNELVKRVSSKLGKCA